MACSTRSSFTPRAATCRSTIKVRWCANSRSWSSFRGEVAKRLLEGLEARDGLMMRQVEMQRRDRDEAALDGVEIRSFSRMPHGRLAADPVVAPAARIFPL